jgi:hypothetical protein
MQIEGSCLDVGKKGFKYGCRPIISLDACHFKGEIGGQLLNAIGNDENDDMFLIAYAVAEAETRESWEWFIELLIDNIYVGSGEGCSWTIISDRQKVMTKSCLHVYPFFLFLF